MTTRHTVGGVLGALVAMAALAGCQDVVAGSGAPGATGSAASPSPSSPSIATAATSPGRSASPSASVTPERTVTVTGTATGTKYQVSVWAHDSLTDCGAHAHGAPMLSFLQQHPCGGATRYLLTLDVGGRTVGVSAISASFTSDDPNDPYAVTDSYSTLVQQDGTGAINDLLQDGARLPSGPTSLPSPDAFDAESQDNVATTFDAWYLDGPTSDNDPALVTVEQDLFLSGYDS